MVPSREPSPRMAKQRPSCGPLNHLAVIAVVPGQSPACRKPERQNTAMIRCIEVMNVKSTVQKIRPSVRPRKTTEASYLSTAGPQTPLPRPKATPMKASIEEPVDSVKGGDRRLSVQNEACEKTAALREIWMSPYTSAIMMATLCCARFIRIW